MDFVAKRKASRHHKKLTMRKAADKANTMYNTWATPELYHIGSKLVDIVIQTTGMIEIHLVRTRNKKTTNYLKATPEILTWIRDINAMSEVLTPEALPFVIPPKNCLKIYRATRVCKKPLMELMRFSRQLLRSTSVSLNSNASVGKVVRLGVESPQ